MYQDKIHPLVELAQGVREFDGGMLGFLNTLPGAGQGSGGGLGGACVSSGTNTVGAGSYQSVPTSSFQDGRDGSIYGSPLLVPLVGGSGGGGSTGTPGLGGGGGGDAILLASNTRIEFTSANIYAKGAQAVGCSYNEGSGGAICLVAPIVTGTAGCHANGYSTRAGNGYIRVDAIDRSGMSGITFNPTPSVGSFMAVFQNPLPRLDVIEAAGQTIPEGASTAYHVHLPSGSPSNQTVLVQAKDFSGTNLPIRVTLTPESGDPLSYDADIDITGGTATGTVNAVFPVNILTHVHAWTR
ncbi:MAG: hypothetical protein GKR87_07790 [Kiritimatiellae bacterium]|nr:hypothetical protein [Kiritimatiellia bacterium]